MDIPSRLGLTTEEFESLEPHLQHRTYEGEAYRFLPDYRRSLEKGTVFYGDSIVRGFPKIPRTLILETGIPQHFDGRLVAEEKLNGYNIRIARIDGETLAFTRSGLICPFTTYVVRHTLDLDGLFGSFPEVVLCGEMIGPENPYTAHPYPEVDSLAFRAFDLRDRRSGEPFPVKHRRDVCDDHDIPQTRLLGEFDPDEAVDELPDIIDTLDERDREGVVLKSVDGTNPLKYTTSAANQGDLAFAYSLPFDYGQAFTFRRLIREAFQSHEWREDETTRRARAHDLGEAILLSMTESIGAVDRDEPVCERHTVRSDPEAIDRLLDHLEAQGLTIDIESDKVEDGQRVVTFCKRVQKTNDKIDTYLGGTIVDI